MKPHRFAGVLAIVLVYTVLATQSFACTAFQLTSGDGSIIYFRSMEFGFPFNSNVLIIPRGTQYVGTAPDGKPGLKWSAKYGAVGLNVDVAPSLVADGMNEKGLVVGMLYLPGYAQFLPPDPSKEARTIGGWEVGAYLLTTVATVAEAKQVLTSEKAYVAQQIFPAFKQQLPVHFYVGDATGAVVIVEYVNGKLTLHDNPIGTLTNSPPFDWQTTNLANYVNLSPVNVPELNLASKLQIRNFGQGSGMLGIPGDYTPPSRFVRVALFSHWVDPGKTQLETVGAGFHVLNTFDIFKGAIRTTAANPSGDVTEWAVAHDRTNLKTYVRTDAGQTIQMVDLKKIDFSQPGLRQIALNYTFAPVDVTSAGTALAAK
jgi:choloylglycine hydrolase